MISNHYSLSFHKADIIIQWILLGKFCSHKEKHTAPNVKTQMLKVHYLKVEKYDRSWEVIGEGASGGAKA